MSRSGTAVIGMACRFPGGVMSPADYWELLAGEVNAIEPVPVDRWNSQEVTSKEVRPGKTYASVGGFLTDPFRFDAQFFGISPREAVSMDPQHRVFLEVACEALHDAGIPLDTLRGARVAVILGVYLNDYGERFSYERPDLLDPYYMTGNTLSAAPGRLAYRLGLEGPVYSTDAACASSLVTVHQGRRALQNDDCDLAIVGGVNMMLSPRVSISASQGQILAPDGLCKAFDHRADGYARSEGCGVVVLKRLDESLADHDRVRAVVAGSAVRHGGRTAGLTVPGSRSQVAVIKQALDDAGVQPGEVSFVEAHGTGTPLGDPVEFKALRTVYGTARSEDDPCIIGAVKSNIGHCETAAGIAGLIKTVLCIEHGTVPANLHMQEPSPACDPEGVGLAFADSLRPLTTVDDTHLVNAAVSSFGLTGTVAHAIIQSPPRPADGTEPDVVEPSSMLLPLSAASVEGLATVASEFAALIDEPDTDLASVLWSAAVRRTAHPQRGAVQADSRAALVSELQRLSRGEGSARIHCGESGDLDAHGLLFVFSGHGSQWEAMGEHFDGWRHAAYRETMAEVSSLFSTVHGIDIRAALAQTDLSGAPASVVQPVAFAVQAALFNQWTSWGIEADGVIGHSVGEVAAAFAAGVLELEQAVAVVAARSRAIRSLDKTGSMAGVQLNANDTLALLESLPFDVFFAADNGPTACVVSGTSPNISRFIREARRRDVNAREIPVGFASHCPLVEPALDDFRSDLGTVTAKRSSIPIYSATRAAVLEGSEMDAEYWISNLRDPVHFHPALRLALAEAHTDVLEISAHPVLLPAIAEVDPALQLLASMRRDEPDDAAALASLGRAFCRGRQINWSSVYPTLRAVEIPGNPWTDTRFELPTSTTADAHVSGVGRVQHVQSAGLQLWSISLSSIDTPGLFDHLVGGVRLLPFSAIIGLCLQACSATEQIIELDVKAPVVLLGERRDLQLRRIESGVKTVVELADGSESDTVFATATVARRVPAQTTQTAMSAPAETEVTDLNLLYDDAEQMGVTYGEGMRVVRTVWATADGLAADVVSQPYGLNDASWSWIEGVVQLASRLESTTINPDADAATPVPSFVDSAASPAEATVASIEVRVSDGEYRGYALDDDGVCVGTITGLRFETMQAGRAASTWIRELAWDSIELPHDVAVPDNVILMSFSTPQLTRLSNALSDRGIPTAEVLLERGLSIAVQIESLSQVLARDGFERAPIVFIAGSDEADELLGDRFLDKSSALLALSQAIGARDPLERTRLVVVTESATSGQSCADQAALWGLGRAITSEATNLDVKLVDLDIDVDVHSESFGHGLIGALTSDEFPAELRIGSGTQADVPHLHPPKELGARSLRLRGDSSYLVVGGFSALATPLCEALAAQGARRIILASRTPLGDRRDWTTDDPSATIAQRRSQILMLERMGLEIQVVELDASDECALQALIERNHEEQRPPIRGVFHLAAVVDDRLLSGIQRDQLDRAFQAKVLAASNLDRCFPELDCFVLFSSAAAFFPMPGQAAYAACNAALGAIARSRRGRGAHALAVYWSAIEGGGLAATQGAQASIAALASAGIVPLAAPSAMSVLGRLMDTDACETAIVGTSGRLNVHSPLLAESDRPSSEPTPLALEILRCNPDGRIELLIGLLVEHLSAVLYMDPDAIDHTRPFIELGLDSLMAVELRARLMNELSLVIPATAAFDHPTIELLASYLATQLADPDGAAATHELPEGAG